MGCFSAICRRLRKRRRSGPSTRSTISFRSRSCPEAPTGRARDQELLPVGGSFGCAVVRGCEAGGARRRDRRGIRGSSAELGVRAMFVGGGAGPVPAGGDRGKWGASVEKVQHAGELARDLSYASVRASSPRAMRVR